METTDKSIVAGLKREKNEEVGEDCQMHVYSAFSMNLLYTKADGNQMILPHYAAVFESGDIMLSDEYSEYQWVPLSELEDFEPKVPNIPKVTSQLLTLLKHQDSLESILI